ncbi:MAG TPA: HAD-IC family P-type ATPase, partial [Thermoplasmata archaeon]
MPDDWHALTVEETFHRLESSPLGLNPADATRRLARYGPNELQQLEKISPLKIFLSQFLNVLIIVLIVAAVISGALGILGNQVEELYDATLIAIIVILNAIFGFVQEYRAERSLEALRSLAAPKARVIREAESILIPAREVVPGDIVVLTTGEQVPADGRILEAVNLQANEASLTGESIPVSKMTA